MWSLLNQMDSHLTSIYTPYTCNITDESQRKAAFNERKKDLIKEVSELSPLCGVEAYAIIHDANEPEPEVWPSHVTAHTVLERFHMSKEGGRQRKLYIKREEKAGIER
ncbi:hypothetical protein RD792_011463 [Penstemon davidsonii]|uniref:MADS-box domain-containing protein n=1 Tax=Penstemon davidsonii TaxID=160366 RepID=A0ABR0D4N8_9LAMI|nr:hypothetical protein RD792_011463 [Penstemon davidsonii]